MQIKDIFDKADGGALTWEQFESAMNAGNAKFADLSEGNYVSKQKYSDEVNNLNGRITSLTDTISARDADLTNLRNTLDGVGDLNALRNASKDLESLQKRYDKETKEYQQKLSKQAYEFAVKEFAGTKKFTSQAAKRDFINTMLNKNLTMENDKIIGAEDFVKSYQESNEDAFLKDAPKPADPPQPKPQFVNPTQGANPTPQETNDFVKAFNFVGVRAKRTE